MTAENKQEAERVVELYTFKRPLSEHKNVFVVLPLEISIKAAIQDRQSVLEALDIVYNVTNDWNECIRAIEGMKENLTQQIEWLQNKL